MTREALVGLIFAGAMAALGYFTIFVSDSDLFGLLGDRSSQQFEYKVVFDRVDGLENGMKVKLDGWEFGEVTSFAPRPDGIEVTLSCRRKHDWRAMDKVRVKDVSPLGGKYVDIERADEGETFEQPPANIRGTVLGGLLAEGGKTINKLEGKIDAAIEEIKQTFENLNRITARIDRGEGAMGKIFKDEELYSELLGTVKDLRKFSKSLASDDGTIALLVKDRALYDRLSSAATNLDQIIAGVVAGKGTAGKLFNDATLHDDLQLLVKDLRAAISPESKGSLAKFIHDGSLYDNANATVKEAKELITQVRTGPGTLGKLINDDTLYKSLNQAVLDVKAITGDLRAGRGTLGKLLTDDAVYKDLRRVLGELGRSLEDTREQAPVNTFTSVIFSAF